MTIIIALAHEQGVTIGSDRIACHGNFVAEREKQKWIHLKRGFWVASSGTADIREILVSVGAEIEAPIHPFVLCGALRLRLREVERWSSFEPDGGGAPNWGVSLLMTDGESVWETSDSLYPVLAEPREPVTDGAGWAFAQGAMHLAMASALSPELIVREGLRAAIYCNTLCGGEPWVATITKEKPIEQSP